MSSREGISSSCGNIIGDSAVSEVFPDNDSEPWGVETIVSEDGIVGTAGTSETAGTTLVCVSPVPPVPSEGGRRLCDASKITTGKVAGTEAGTARATGRVSCGSEIPFGVANSRMADTKKSGPVVNERIGISIQRIRRTLGRAIDAKMSY